MFLSVTMVLSKGTTFQLVEDNREVNQQVATVAVAATQSGPGDFVICGHRLLRHPRCITGFWANGQRGFHHGYVGGAVFAAASPTEVLNATPTLHFQNG